MSNPLNYLISKNKADLSECLVVACQHLLKSNIILFDALLDCGLKKENLYIIGKAYSTHAPTYKLLLKKGYNVHPSSIKFDSHQAFDDEFAYFVEQFLQSVIKKTNLSKYKKVIIVDDGGQMLLTANDLVKNKSNLVGVEQTSSGYARIKNTLDFPVVNVARSKTKLEIESKFIAEVVIAKARRYLKKKAEILIVGQGPIGKNIGKILNKDFKIFKYDKTIHKDSFPGRLEEKLNKYDLIIGCTGNAIIQPGHFNSLKKGAVLISASSSDREFSAVYLRSLLPKYKNLHRNLKVKSLLLVNSGFPVNFTGSAYSLTLKQSLLTRSLMLAGILQAVKIKGKSIVGLNNKMQGFILKSLFREQLF